MIAIDRIMGILDAPHEHSSPSWSMRGVESDDPPGLAGRPDDTPGPGSYDTRERRNASAAYSFGCGHVERSLGTVTDGPGPGAYTDVDPGMAKHATPAWSLHGAEGDQPSTSRTDRTPGPGSYEAATRDASAAFSFGCGHADRSLVTATDGPGPGAYANTDPNAAKRTMPSWSLHGVADADPSVRGGYEYDATPGPGAYDSTPPTSAATAFSFGCGHASRDLAMPSDTPGPGTYASATDLIRPRAAAYSMGSPHEGGALPAEHPGPGAHTPAEGSSVLSTRSRRPCFSFGHAASGGLADGTSELGPGPGAYSPTAIHKPSAPAFGMGVPSASDGLQTAAAATEPGPGAYSPTSAHKPTARAVGMGAPSTACRKGASVRDRSGSR